MKCFVLLHLVLFCKWVYISIKWEIYILIKTFIFCQKYCNFSFYILKTGCWQIQEYESFIWIHDSQSCLPRWLQSPSLRLPTTLIDLSLMFTHSDLSSLPQLTLLKKLTLITERLTDALVANMVVNCPELQSVHLGRKF